MRMRAWIAAFGVVAAVTLGWLLSQPPAERAAIPSAVPPVEESRLKNGLRVVTWTHPGSPTVALSLGFPRGASRDPDDREGLAHLVEHLMFRHRYPDGSTHNSFISDVSGYANAITSHDATIYTTQVARNQLELLFWLEAHRFSGPQLTDDDLRTELEIVTEEYLLTAEQVGGEWWTEVSEALFRESCYDSGPLGNPPELVTLILDEVQEYCRETHVADGAVLAVSGGVEHSRVVKLAKKYFGEMPAGKPRKPLAEPQIEPGRIATAANVHEPTLAIIFPTPSLGHRDESTLEVFAWHVSEALYGAYLEESSPLFTHAPYCGLWSLAETGFFAVHATVKAGIEPEQATQELWRRLNVALNQPITPESADRALRNLLAWGLPDLSSDWGRANALTKSWLTLGRWKVYGPETLDPQRLRTTAEKYVRRETAVELWVEPRDIDGLAKDLGEAIELVLAEQPVAATEERSSPTAPPRQFPPPGDEAPLDEEVLRLEPASMVNRELPNGLSLVIIESPGEISTSWSFTIDGGAQTDRLGASGTSWLVTASAQSALHTRDVPVAKRWNLQTYNEETWFFASALSDERAAAVECIATILRSERPSGIELSKGREWLATSARAARSNPSTIADSAFWGQVMGDHRRTSFGGTGIDPLKISDKSIEEWWRTNVRPEHVTIYAIGPEDPEQVADDLERALGDWSGANSTSGDQPLEDPETRPSRLPGVYVVDLPTEQVQIRVGYPIPRATPEQRAAVLRFFGYLDSGLTDGIGRILRREHGYTYHVSADVEYRDGMPFLFVQTATRVENVTQVLSLIREELEKLRRLNWHEEDLTIDPLWINRTISTFVSTPSGTIDWLHRARRGRVHPDPVEHYAELNALTGEDLSVASQWLSRPEELRIVLVGPFDELRAETKESEFSRLRRIQLDNN